MRRHYFYLGLICLLLTVTALTPQPVLAEGDPPPTPHPVQPPWITGRNTQVTLSEDTLTEIDPSGVVNISPLNEIPILANPPDFVELIPQDTRDTSSKLNSLAVPQRFQDPDDPTCGAAALGMALEFLSLSEDGMAPDSDTLIKNLQSNGFLYKSGTGIEELAYLARAYGYRGTSPFTDWTLENLAGELAAGRPSVVPLGLNGSGQPGHFVTVTGMAADGSWVQYNDPILGEQTVSADDFLASWSLQGYSGLTVNKQTPAAAADPLLPWMGLLGAVSVLAVLARYYPANKAVSGILAKFQAALGNPARKGLGGKLEAGAGGGSSANLIKVPIYETQLVRKGNKTIEVKETVYATKKIKIGSHQETYTEPKYENIQVQVGTRPVSKTVPNYVWKNIQVGYKQVTEKVKVTKYRTESYKVWGKKTTKVPVYKNVKYVRYYKYKSVKKTKWVRQGWRWKKKTYYTTKKVPVYGTKKKFTGYKNKTSWGWQTKTRKVPYTDYKTVTRTVPDYKRMRVQQGTKTITEEIPVYRNKKIQVGYETKTRTVADYEEIKYPVGTRTVTKTVPNFEEVKVRVGWDYVQSAKNTSPRQQSNHDTETDYSYEQELMRNRTQNYLVNQNANRDEEPELEPVPGIFEDPLGWLQNTIINAGRQNEIVKDTVVATANIWQEYDENVNQPLVNGVSTWPGIIENTRTILEQKIVQPVQETILNPTWWKEKVITPVVTTVAEGLDRAVTGAEGLLNLGAYALNRASEGAQNLVNLGVYSLNSASQGAEALIGIADPIPAIVNDSKPTKRQPVANPANVTLLKEFSEDELKQFLQLQPDGDTCAVTSAAMAVNMLYGTKISAEAMTTYLHESPLHLYKLPWFGPPPPNQEQALNYLFDSSEAPFSADLTQDGTHADLIDNLNDGKITIVNISHSSKLFTWPPYNGVGHAMVLVGYDANTDEYLLLDPGNDKDIRRMDRDDFTTTWKDQPNPFIPSGTMITIEPEQ